MKRMARESGGIEARASRGRHARGTRAGFTLIELLVVISVIALLISITLPALSSSRETSRRAKCLANVRSIGMGMQMYMDAAGKGILPYVNPLHGTGNPNDPSLLDLLSEYLNSEVPRLENPADPNSMYFATDPYKCPSDMGGVGNNNNGEPLWRTSGSSYEFVPGIFMLTAEFLFVPRPAFGVTKAIEKAHEKQVDWPIVADFGEWHPGRPQKSLPKSNACFMPDWHTDWVKFRIDDQAFVVDFIADIRRLGGQ